MSIAVVSLLALVVIVVISCFFTRLNPGLLAVFAAVTIGFYLGDLSVGQVLSFFPSKLFILLLSMTLIFGVAQENGTLEKITQRALYLIRGQEKLLPILIFVLAFLFSALGPGNIAAVAVLAPLAMFLAKKHSISPVLIAIMLCTGANAGAFSPFSPTGVVTLGLLEQISINTSLIWVVFGASAILQSISALFAYALFIFRTKQRTVARSTQMQVLSKATEKQVFHLKKLASHQKITLILISSLLIGVVFIKIPLTIMAVTVAVALFLCNLAEEEKVLRLVPWGTIIMVTGIAVLIGLMEKVGGLDLATSFIASVTSSTVINGVLAFVSGLVSAYSSSSGVVLPAFIPLIPGLAEKTQILNTIPMVIAVAVGSHMVDVSPLSTLGALSIAAVDSKETRDRMFRVLMIWGMSMSLVAGVLAFIFLDLLI